MTGVYCYLVLGVIDDDGSGLWIAGLAFAAPVLVFISPAAGWLAPLPTGPTERSFSTFEGSVNRPRRIVSPTDPFDPALRIRAPDRITDATAAQTGKEVGEVVIAQLDDDDDVDHVVPTAGVAHDDPVLGLVVDLDQPSDAKRPQHTAVAVRRLRVRVTCRSPRSSRRHRGRSNTPEGLLHGG